MPQEEIVKTQIGENLRFYGDMRFKHLTLLMAWLTLAGAGVVERGTTELVGSVPLRTIVACVSMFFTGALWAMEVRASLYWETHRAIAPELWPQPKKQFLPLVRATIVVVFVYAGVYVLWLWLALAWGLACWCAVPFAIVLLALIVFSIGNYWLVCARGRKRDITN